MDWKTLHSCALASVLAVGIGGTAAALVAPSVVQAQPASVRGLPDFTDLVEQVGPSVVNIRTLEKVSSPSVEGASNSGMDEEMREFFKRFGLPMPNLPNGPRQQRPQRPQHPQSEEEQPRGVGSGFIVSSDGFVMTNAHVVEGADEVLVTLTDSREFKAKIVGLDKRSDVAVVKIQASVCPPSKLAMSSDSKSANG